MYLITPAFSGIFGLVFLIAWIVLAVIALVNMVRSPWLNLPGRLVWMVMIVAVPVLGASVYLFWKKVRRVES